MKKTVITTDSGVVIGSDEVITVPLVVIDTETDRSYLDQTEITATEVYSLRTLGHRMTTSCMSITEAEEFFTAQLQTADQIIHLTMSNKISQGAYVSALHAAGEVSAERIRVIDSLQGGSGGPVVAHNALRLAGETDDLNAMADALTKDIIPRIKTAFIVPDPTGYKASGKGILNGFINMGLSAFAAGSGLPVIKINANGSLLPTKKLRPKADENMYIAFFDSQFDPGQIADDFVSVTTLMPDADRLQGLKDHTAAQYPNYRVNYGQMSAVIASYACKDTLGVSYLTKG